MKQIDHKQIRKDVGGGNASAGLFVCFMTSMYHSSDNPLERIGAKVILKLQPLDRLKHLREDIRRGSTTYLQTKNYYFRWSDYQ